ncbi:hypothetical protein EAS64_30045 [Trebonia kvetii]|uniref:Uncharacterized protein n=1 Tax=Trebonia kvetii TaxID=2480626 RepID=A0A6P2BTM4_9ACTN|nr:DUF6188 family protein [Trebonia kvetii]TVZ01711.1 hypothetical protein EAS64_30045 [Trebonia kvetii]
MLLKYQRDRRMYEWIKRHRSRQAGGIAVQTPASLIGSQVFQIKFDYQTHLELLHQADNGSIRVHLDLVIFSPFVLRSSDGTIHNLNPQTSRTTLAPVIDLRGGTITSVTVDGDETVEHDSNGNPINALGTLTVDFADGAQITVPAVADPYYESWDLNYREYL